MLKQLLERFDFYIDIVSSGEEALKALALTRYAAVIMDITLPGMDGYECTRAIRDLQKNTEIHTPIIALTGRAEPEDRAKCFLSGMDDYLSKPFDTEELRRLLLRWVYEPDQPNLKLLKGYDGQRQSGVSDITGKDNHSSAR